MSVVIASLGALGVYLLYTAFVMGWRDFRLVAVRQPGVRRTRARDWLVQAGITDVKPAEFAAVVATLFVIAALVTYLLFGGILPALTAGAFAGTFPLATYRVRREKRRSEARESWPRIIEEIRILTSSLGRSIPQALFEAGRRAPNEMRGAFEAAEREWLLSTDFDRTTTVLKSRLADATADAACETLLVAHQLGGGDLDRRLAALVEDRVLDLQGRKDARSKQAGVRFARRFVLLVPLGMAFAGLSIGTGRSAYESPMGQAAVVVGISMVVACWAWAGRLLRLPEEQRVFHQ